MAVPDITYRLVKGSSLTHTEMDNNFRAVFYSSSIEDGGDTLHLYYDTEDAADGTVVVPLNGGSGGVSVVGNVDNRILTATGGTFIEGESSFTFDASTNLLTLAGTFSVNDGQNNLIIGAGAGGAITSGENTNIGVCSATNLTGLYNTVLGYKALGNATASTSTVALGHGSLGILSSGNNNVAIGREAGVTLTTGAGNIYLGYNAGPASNTAQSNKLYINNAASDTPLILGDFNTGQVTFNSQVSASVFSGSFYGDGTNLTGLTVTEEWDGTRDGDAEITGSLIVSGASVIVDLTNTLAISGSIFSGSFVGDGSGLTGVQADTFPYTGSAEITGSLQVEGPTSITGSLTATGSLVVYGESDLNGKVTVDENIEIYNPTSTSIGIGFCINSGASSSPVDSIIVGYRAGESAVGCRIVAAGTQALTRGSISSVAMGYRAQRNNNGSYNVVLGSLALGSSATGTASGNVGVGYCSLYNLWTGLDNVGVGFKALSTSYLASGNVAVGSCSLTNARSTVVNTGDRNTAIGYSSGQYLRDGRGNIYIGYCAGPSTANTDQSNKLYINNSSGNPLIGGDFSIPSVTISGSLLVSQSVTASAFSGDGSGLTNLPSTEWDGSRNGDAEITGSFVVSGSSVVVDFTNTLAISGSTFSGSFEGDGSGLTGVTSEWDGTRDGNAEITGSFTVTGKTNLQGNIAVGEIGTPGVEIIHFYSSSLSGTHDIQDFTISATGYTGFKADYSLTNAGEDEKKIGTLLGAWDQSGGTTINDSHTIATGNINNTSFNITSDGSTATLQIDASTGTYEVNMLITAFKRSL